MAACVSQHMHSMTSAERANSTTLLQGCVSPVMTTLPSSVSMRYASESRYGWTCSAGAAVTCHVRADARGPAQCPHAYRGWHAREDTAAVAPQGRQSAAYEPTVGIAIQLEDEHGDALELIEWPTRLVRMLPSYDDESFQCLRFIDPYGNTIFNVVQCRLCFAR